jgi:hypothetical protein
MEEPITVDCPWCGESFVTFFDMSAGAQTYIEDCQVCCRPIQLECEVSRRGRISCRSTRS